MFSFLRKLAEKLGLIKSGRPLPVEMSFDVYKPHERKIYTYWDGEKEVKADPLILYKEVSSNWASISVDISVARSPMKGNVTAHNNLVKVLRRIFSIKPFEEGGLTEQELFDLFDHFLIYSEVIKKNSNRQAMSQQATSPNTQQPTVDTSSASVPESQPTKSPSDSSSTVSESDINKPIPSSSEPESPLESSTQDSTTTEQSQTEKKKLD